MDQNQVIDGRTLEVQLKWKLLRSHIYILSLYAAPDQMSIHLNKLPWHKPRISAYMRWQIEISPITTAKSGRFMRVANIYIFDDIGRFSE